MTTSVQAVTKCKLSKFELPITMSGLKPTITAKINDVDAKFVLDSGAFFSMISSATAAQFNLRRSPAPLGLKVSGIGGSTDTSITTVRVFTLAGIPMRNVEFLVGGSETGGGSIGVLGQNFLESWDVEYDFAKGVVRLFKAEDCKHTFLAYWVTPEQPLSTMDIGYTTPLKPHATGTAFINGTKIRVMFDSGASTSMLSLKAAARAGVTPDTAGTVDAGYSSGIGRRTVKSYIAPFLSFKVGDGEEIKNTRLRIADVDLDEGDMLLGADFFLSHHIYIANSQRRVYFTYNGGPVFNLSKSVSDNATGDPAEAQKTKSRDDEPADAAAVARRGEAFAARRDFEHAIADLTRALELNPNESEYTYQRGMAYWGNKQPNPALADFDHALELNPDHLAARMSRAQLHLDNKDIAVAIPDLDAAVRIAPKEGDMRFTLAELYARADLLAPALAQFDLWISNHPDDSKRANALTGRALVRLRMGDYDKSIADYDASLKLASENAWALYGRGIAKTRKNKLAEGEADRAAAVKLSPHIGAEFTRRGITP